MVDRPRCGGIQVQQARLGLQGHQLQPQQVARIAQEAPAQGADAPGAAGDEAPQAGAAIGAGHQPQGPAPGLELLVQVFEQDPRLGRDHTRFAIEAAQSVEAGEIEHQPAGQGHALAVVARGCAPQGEAYPLAPTGRRHP